jgi:6-phosphogluconolactonase (cycloisomerase 2 family)
MLQSIALSLLAGQALAARLYTSHYSGRISLLDLTESAGQYTRSETQTLNTGFLPSWLTYDASSRMLYLSDEGPPANGYLSAFAADGTGRLTLSANATEHPSGVDNSQYGGPYGKSFIAIAH